MDLVKPVCSTSACGTYAWGESAIPAARWLAIGVDGGSSPMKIRIGEGREVGNLGYGEQAALDDRFVRVVEADEREEVGNNTFVNLGLTIAIFAPVLVAYAAIAYGVYFAWTSLT
jgi:hypothetical protein